MNASVGPQAVPRSDNSLAQLHCRGVNWSHRKNVARDVLARKHVTNGVTYSGFWGWAEVDRAWCIHTGWSLSLMCYHRRSGPDPLSLLSSTQQALPVSSILTPGCHQRHCQTQRTETISRTVKKLWYRCNFTGSSVTYQQLMLRQDQMLLRKFNTWLALCYEPVWQHISSPHSSPQCFKLWSHDTKYYYGLLNVSYWSKINVYMIFFFFFLVFF